MLWVSLTNKEKDGLKLLFIIFLCNLSSLRMRWNFVICACATTRVDRWRSSILRRNFARIQIASCCYYAAPVSRCLLPRFLSVFQPKSAVQCTYCPWSSPGPWTKTGPWNHQHRPWLSPDVPMTLALVRTTGSPGTPGSQGTRTPTHRGGGDSEHGVPGQVGEPRAGVWGRVGEPHVGVRERVGGTGGEKWSELSSPNCPYSLLLGQA